MNGIVYVITNNVNDKAYVGITSTSLDIRWDRHLHTASKRKAALQHAIKKYGKDQFSIISIQSGILTAKTLKSLEQFYIRSFNTKAPNGYNLTDGGDGVVNPSEETKKKMSEASKGREAWNKGLKGAQKAWNKGLHGVLEVWNKGIKMPGGMVEARMAAAKLGPWNKGLKGSQVAWNKGLGFTEEERKQRHKEADARYRARKKQENPQ